MAGFTYDVNDPTMQAILGIQGSSPYTPELTEQSVARMRGTAAENTAANVAATQSDLMRRGGTGSSTELLAMNNARDLGTRAGEDQVLNWMLGIADRTAQDRQFKTGLAFQDYNTKYNSWNDQMLADKYMAQLAIQQAEERKRARKKGIGGLVGSTIGAGVGGFFGGPIGAGVGMQAGSGLGFLFS